MLEYKVRAVTGRNADDLGINLEKLLNDMTIDRWRQVGITTVQPYSASTLSSAELLVTFERLTQDRTVHQPSIRY